MPRNSADSTLAVWCISSATPMTVAMLVSFHRLSVCEMSGGIVMRSACGSTMRRMVAMKPRPSARPASNCTVGTARMPLRMSSDM